MTSAEGNGISSQDMTVVLRDIASTLVAVQASITGLDAKFTAHESKSETQMSYLKEASDKNEAALVSLTQRVEKLESAGPMMVEGEDAMNVNDKLVELEKKLNSKWMASGNTALYNQNQLSNNIMIVGIPVLRNEDELAQTVKHLGNLIGVTLMDEDFTEVYRKSAETGIGAVIVKFAIFSKKIELMSAKKKWGKVMSSDFCNDDAASVEVFINHHTTPMFGHLLKLGRAAVVQKRVQAAYLTVHGMAVRKEGGGVKMITSVTEWNAWLGIKRGRGYGAGDTKATEISHSDKKRGRPHKRKPSAQADKSLEKKEKPAKKNK